MTDYIKDISALESLYGTPGEASLIKVTDHLLPAYRDWVLASKFCVLTTVGPEGTDGSPRGDDEPVCRILDDKTLAMPDWRGNNRLDSLRNIVRDGRVSIMLMVPGNSNVLRINGTAQLTADPDLRASFEKSGKQPTTVIILNIQQVYTQCARAIIRAGLWGDQTGPDLPSIGTALAQAKAGFDAAGYDADWAPRAAKTMW